jgi:hypothetical protein
MYLLPTSIKLSDSAIYRPIMEKFGTHNRKYAAIFQDGHRRHLENE